MAEEDFNPYDSRGIRRMEAYYYSFDETGCEPVDRLLAEIAWAGKAFHNTSEWHGDEDTNHIERIQKAANAAATAFDKEAAQ